METTSSVSQHFAQCTLLIISERQTSMPASYEESRAPGLLRQAKSLVLRGQRSTSPQLLRCKRTAILPGADLTFPHQQQLVASVARRNERERNRVRQVNAGFQTLRQHVPNGATNGRLSKVETLRSAVEYIRALQQLLDENDAVPAAFQTGRFPSPPLTVSSGLSAGPESPHSTCSSSEEAGSYENMSPEEHELMDFTAWFHR